MFFIKKNKIIPKKNELWKFIDNSPWPKDYPPVKILDVKDGWVRYKMTGLFFQDERLELKTFLYCYKKSEL